MAVVISKNGNRKEFNGADSAESSNKLGSLTVRITSLLVGLIRRDKYFGGKELDNNVNQFKTILVKRVSTGFFTVCLDVALMQSNN